MRAGAPKGAVPYAFRHTFISRRLEAGMPTSLVAEHCGTSEYMIKKNYAKFCPSETLRWLNATAPSARSNVVKLHEAAKSDEQMKEAA